MSSFHLAGIIPVAGKALDFNMPWHDALMPVAQNYLAVERAVVECAYAGCKTIWIICNDDIQPLIRYRLGDMVEDPVWSYRYMDPQPGKSKKAIPIFYVPIHPKDRDKRDCLAWSVIHGALTSLKVSSQLSKWVSPDKYYVSFPYGVFPVEELREHRKLISSKNNFYVIVDNKSVADDYYCSFTFGKDEFIRYRKNIRSKGTGMYTTEKVDSRGIPRSYLPLEERYSARFFNLSDVFEICSPEGANLFTPSAFYNVASWEEYRAYMALPETKALKRPWAGLMRYREFNPIGVDE